MRFIWILGLVLGCESSSVVVPLTRTINSGEALVFRVLTPNRVTHLSLRRLGGDTIWLDASAENSKREFNVELPDLPSDVYLINGREPVVVKNPEQDEPIVVVYPTNTDAAYNSYEGINLYHGSDDQYESRARKVAFARPMNGVQKFAQGCLTWLNQLPSQERKLFRFIGDVDLEDYSQIAGAQLVVLIGHSEYWTRLARLNFDRYVDEGGSAAILSGNTMWWQVRYEDNFSNLVCFRNQDEDPIDDPLLETLEWPTSSLKYPVYPSTGTSFNNGGYGPAREDPEYSGYFGYKILADQSPLLRGTGLTYGEVLPLMTDEADGAPVSGLDADDRPIIDNTILNFLKVELIAYDQTVDQQGKGYATFIAFQKTSKSGQIVNVASTDWCAEEPDDSNQTLYAITRNILFLLYNGESVFSP
jgi:hypothetical protein